MAVFPILPAQHPMLGRVAARVPKIDDSIRRLAADMVETMQSVSGTGLAAPQIGRPLRVIICQDADEEIGPLTLINPQISKLQGSVIDDEGCLSLPGWVGPVARAERLTLTGLNEHGTRVRFTAEGFLARVIQHEFDHLEGIMFTSKIVDGGELRFTGTVESGEVVKQE